MTEPLTLTRRNFKLRPYEFVSMHCHCMSIPSRTESAWLPARRPERNRFTIWPKWVIRFASIFVASLSSWRLWWLMYDVDQSTWEVHTFSNKSTSQISFCTRAWTEFFTPIPLPALIFICCRLVPNNIRLIWVSRHIFIALSQPCSCNTVFELIMYVLTYRVFSCLYFCLHVRQKTRKSARPNGGRAFTRRPGHHPRSAPAEPRASPGDWAYRYPSVSRWRSSCSSTERMTSRHREVRPQKGRHSVCACVCYLIVSRWQTKTAMSLVMFVFRKTASTSDI